MTRVPPSNNPKAPAPQVLRPRTLKAPKQIEKPVKLKTGAEEGEVHEAAKTGEGQGGAAHDPHEAAKLSEIWQPESHAEKAEKKEAKEEAHEEEKAAAEGGSTDAPKSFLKQIKPALNAPPKPPLQQKKPSDGFENQQQTANAQKLAETRATVTGTVKAVVPLKAAAPVSGAHPAVPAKPAKPPDAFSVLHAAQDPGVYFKEDGANGAAEQADPELTAAIEEAIRLLFGVRGILRVTGGFNQEQQPVIIVVGTQGFGEASMKLVPPKVHKFETVLALPYDMLPLKRERL